MARLKIWNAATAAWEYISGNDHARSHDHSAVGDGQVINPGGGGYIRKGSLTADLQIDSNSTANRSSLLIQATSGQAAYVGVNVAGDSNSCIFLEGDASFQGIGLGGGGTQDAGLFRTGVGEITAKDTGGDLTTLRGEGFEAEFPAMPFAGGNLVANPSFELVAQDYSSGTAITSDAEMAKNMPGWTAVDVPANGGSVSFTTAAANVPGDGLVRLGMINGNPTSTGRVYSQYFPVVPGSSLQAAMLLRGTAGNSGSAFGAGWLRWYKADKTASATTESNVIANYDVGTSATWVRKTGIVTVPTDALFARYLCVLSSASAVSNFVGYDAIFVGSIEYGYVPSGAIMLWSGQTTTIPIGWFLCDGTNGTPDLRDRFIIGADTTNEGTSGGTVSASAALATHATHTSGGAHNHDSHTSSATGTPVGGGAVQSGTGANSLTAHTHNVTASPTTHSSDGGHTHNAHDAHAVMNYYRLAYIMKA